MIPVGKDSVSGKTVGVGTGSAIFQSLQLSDEMGPAKLADTLFMVGIIG